MATVTRQIQVRQGTAAQWASANPVLLAGEYGLETDTTRVKIGDGSTAWNSLRYGTRPPFSRATLTSGTVLAQAPTESPAVVGSILTSVVTGAGHTFAADGITVGPGEHMVRMVGTWSATNSAIRAFGVHDGSEYLVNGSGALSLRHVVTQLVVVPSATKLQPAYVADTSTASARTLSSNAVTSFSVLTLS